MNVSLPVRLLKVKTGSVLFFFVSNLPNAAGSQSSDRPSTRPKGHVKSASTSYAVRPDLPPLHDNIDPLRPT